MSAYGTVDARDQQAFQETFPYVFSRTFDRGFAYLPQRLIAEQLPEGADFQSYYHRQKQYDANRSVLNGVRDTRRSTNRAMISHNHYFGMPAPSLVQRRFANPSGGAYILDSARRTQGGPFRMVEASEDLTGGVLRSAVGQQFGRDRLRARIAELNRIDENHFPSEGMDLESLLSGAPRPLPSQTPQMPNSLSTPTTGSLSETAKIEFNLLRQRVIDALEDGFSTEITLGEVGRLIQLLFRYVPTATGDELDDIWSGFTANGGLIELITELNSDDYEYPSKSQYNEAVALSMYTLLTKAMEYTRVFIENRNLSPKEKVDLSKAMVKSLKFKSLLRTGRDKDPVKSLLTGEREGALTARESQRLSNVDGDDADFDRPAQPRLSGAESTGDGDGRQYFDGSVRDVFGKNSGAYLGEEGPMPSTGAIESMATKEMVNKLDAEDTELDEAQVLEATFGRPRVPRVRKPRTPSISESELPPAPPRRRKLYRPETTDGMTSPRQPGIPSKPTNIPETKAQLTQMTGNTREGYERLGRQLGIAVYKKSSVPNIRKNFVRRLNLTGK